MKKYILLFAALTFFTPVNSQKVLSIQDLNLKQGLDISFLGSTSPQTEIIPVSDNLNDGYSLVFVDRQIITAFHYKNNEIIESNRFIKPDGVKDILGASKNNESYFIYFKFSKKNLYGVFEFNSNSKKSNFITFELPKKEKFVYALSDYNKFIILTSSKSVSNIISYNFTGGKEYVRNSFELSKFRLNSQAYPISYLLSSNALSATNESLEYVPSSVPSNFNLTKSNYKLYFDGKDQIVITLDNIMKHTDVLEMNLTTGSVSQDRFIKNNIACEGDYNQTSNSLIFNDHLLQIIGCKNYFNLSITEIETGLTKASFTTTPEDEIYFKNTPIFQEGGVYSTDRSIEIEETKRFLRKFSKGTASLAINYSNNQELCLSAGSVQIVTSSPGSVGGFSSSSTFSTPAGPITTTTYNPVYTSYTTNSWTKTTYFKTKLNHKFEFVEGKVKDSVLDKIEIFEEPLNDIQIKTLFKHNDKFIYAYYNKQDKKFVLVEFEE